MSVPTTLIKQLVSEKPATGATNGTDESSGVDGADGPSLAEIRAAAKEGTAEALAECRSTAPEANAETSSTGGNDSRSSVGSSLKRVLLLGIVTVYLLRRRRSKQSVDAQ